MRFGLLQMISLVVIKPDHGPGLRFNTGEPER